MNKEDLIEYKKKLAELSKEEQQQRLEYIQGLANGEIQGPPVGYNSIDRTSLKYFTKDDLKVEVPHKSIYQFLCENTKEYDDKAALKFYGKTITFKQFRQEVEKTKKALYAQGVGPGKTVSVCLPNIPEVGYLFYAITEMGAVANMLDPRTNPTTLCRCVDDAESDLVISLDSVAGVFKDSKAKNIYSVSPINSLPLLVKSILKLVKKELNVKLPKDSRYADYSKFIKKAKTVKELPNFEIDSDKPAAIAYTGGTTGVSKGVIMTHNAFNAMVQENSVVGYNADVGDVCLGMAPPWTFYGLSNSFNTFLNCGIAIDLIPQFGPDDLGQLTLKHKTNHIITVPSALVGMMNDPAMNGADLSFLKTVIVGADKLSPQLEEEFNNFLESHNCHIKVTKGYGMTEACAAAAYSMKGANDPGTVGIPFIYENISVFNPENPDEELTTGQSGELAIQGPKNMVGYFGENANRTDDVLKTHSDGTVWAHTGDLGHIDKDGKIVIDGRLKRMFVKAGFKIFPGEIENHILKHPDVQQAAVVAVDNEAMGNVICAYVTLKPECQHSHEEVIEQINQIVAANVFDYEIPDQINIIEHMPLTGMNKINFRELEKQAAAEVENMNVRKI